MMTRAIICGSRCFSDQELCYSALDSTFRSFSEIEILSGHAKGADQMAEAYAKAKGIPVRTFLPDWKRYGKGAGPFRNREMLDYAKEAYPLVIAFWDGKSRGTKNMIDIAQREGVKVIVFYPNEDSLCCANNTVGSAKDSNATQSLEERRENKLTDLEYLHFEIGGYFSEYKKLTIRDREGVLELDGFSFPRKPMVGYGLHFHDIWSKDRSRRWTRKITMIHFERWKSDYDDPLILDGTQWSLRYKYHGENERTIRGSNAYPDNWADFLMIVNDMMKRLPRVKDESNDALIKAVLRAETGTKDDIGKENEENCIDELF